MAYVIIAAVVITLAIEFMYWKAILGLIREIFKIFKR